MKLLDKAPLETKVQEAFPVVEAPLNVHNVHWARGTKGIDYQRTCGRFRAIHRMFGSGQDTICRWLSSLLSTTQWVCCPFCEPANDIPWKRSQFWGFEVCWCIQDSILWYVVHGRKELSRHSVFGHLTFLSKFLAGSGRVPAERFASSPKHSSRVSPSHAVMLTFTSPRWGSCLLTRPCRPSVRRIEDGKKVRRFMMVHDGSWADICRLHDHVLLEILHSYTDDWNVILTHVPGHRVWCFLSWRDSLL